MDINRFSSRKRKQVRRACLNCQKAHSGCGEQRPCPRCVKRKEEHKCVDAPRRKRKDQPLGDSDTEIAAPAVNKRKRKLVEPSATIKTENSRQHKHSHHHDDEDYDDDDACCGSTNAKSIALAVRNNVKRPRRHNATPNMAKWQQQQHQQQQTPSSAFLSNNNTLAFPFDIKTEKQETTRQSHSGDELSRGYVVNTTTTHHNTRGSFGVMGQLQQNMLSQKLSLLQQQQPQRTQQYNSKEVDDCPFMFNPLEFDCAVPPERQQPQQVCEMPQQQQQQPLQQQSNNDDLSLEWLMPELYLWNTTTTTTTISAPPYMWPEQLPQQQPQPTQQQPQQTTSYSMPQQQQFMPQQLHQASSGSFLLDDNLGFSTEDPMFFSDYRNFEPLFSF